MATDDSILPKMCNALRNAFANETRSVIKNGEKVQKRLMRLT